MKALLPANHNQALSMMPAPYAEIVRNRLESEKVIDVNQVTLNDVVKVSIRSTGRYDEGNDAKVVDFISKGIVRMASDKYKNLTIKELQVILESGIRGEYRRKKDEFIAVNITNIALWVESFYKDAMRKMALNDYNTSLTLSAPKPEPTPEESENIVKKGCIAAWEGFKKDGTLPYSTQVIYEYLRKKLNITWTDAERAEIEKQAIATYKAKLKERNIGRIIETKDGLILEKKRVALHHYFTKLKQSGKELGV